MFSTKIQYWSHFVGLAEGQVMSLLRICLTLHVKRRVKENVKYWKYLKHISEMKVVDFFF